MQIPKRVRIGGIDYAIKHVPRLVSADGDLCNGLFDSNRSVIELNSENELSQGRIEQVLIHEILHGIVFTTGLNLEDEEITVNVLAKGLYQVIKDNPQLFAK
jgi:hypothetical protein